MNLSYRIKVAIITFSILLLLIHSISGPAQFILKESTSISSNHDQRLNDLTFPQVLFINHRLILCQEPHSIKPASGYPVLFLLHGASQYPFAWFLPFNLWSYHQSLFTQKALDAGFFVIVPSSGRPIRPGPHAWSSFIPEFSESEDLQLFQSLFSWIENQSIALDSNQVFCAGFSSGGFMTSRLAKVFPDRFSAILVHSGADADSITFTYKGPEFDCESPQEYPENHPPTLVVHGQKDTLVPYECGVHFYQELQRNNINSTLLTVEEKGHIWLTSISEDMIRFFQSYF